MAKASKKTGPKSSGVKGGVEDALTELQGAWAETEESTGFVDVPDGVYVVQVESATVNKSKNSGRLQVSWDLVIAEGEYQGRHLFKHDGIDDDTGRSYLRGGLARLGIEWPSSPAELPATLEETFGTYVQVRTKTKEGSEFQNTYFTRGLPDYAPTPTEEAGPDDGADTGAVDTGDVDGDGGVDAEPIVVGMKVKAMYGDDPYVGKVTAVDESEQTATVEFEDNTEDTLSWDSLEVLTKPGAGKSSKSSASSSEESTSTSFAVGDAVTADIDGDTYSGTITKLKGSKATVKFEDGDVLEFDVSDLTAAETEEVEETEASDEGEVEEETVSTVSITFDDHAVKPPIRLRVAKAAKAAEFNPGDYKSTADLMVDLAEAYALEGSFSDPMKMIAAIEKAAAG